MAKGIEDVVHVMEYPRRKGEELSLDIVGVQRPNGAEARARLEEYDVTFHDLVPSKRVAQLMRSWAVLVFPSHHEGMSLAVLEGLAAGVPVVAVHGVLPAEMERRPGLHTISHDRLPSRVLAVAHSEPPAPDPWVRGHEENHARLGRHHRRHTPFECYASVPRRYLRWYAWALTNTPWKFVRPAVIRLTRLAR